jgi:glycerol-3-phosphate dehydrogenase (NAD(P)+)
MNTAGVIGAGSFGMAIAKLLAFNSDVLVLCRNQDTADFINKTHKFKNVSLDERVRVTTSYQEMGETCRTIFPAVPSANLRSTMREMSPFLKPSHFIIHCTKGLDIPEDSDETGVLSRAQIRTMSEVIGEETSVLRIGCLSGPNLAREILDGQPTATLVASEFTEVIDEGRRLLNSPQFFVFGSHDIIGAEIAGALKNVFALGSGYLAGLGLGKNIQAMLITRGLHEIVYFGTAMGAKPDAFLGTAGIGDLIATATSTDSRNYKCGIELGKGNSLEDVLADMDEVAEGVRTLKFAKQLAEHYKLAAPITRMLYKIVYEGYAFEDALQYLMRYPYARDVDFI